MTLDYGEYNTVTDYQQDGGKPLSYDQLQGEWLTYYKVASKCAHKAKAQDRQDLNHTIILSLADAQTRLDNNGGSQLSELAMLRIASCRVADYWRTEYRNRRVISLNTVIADGEGNTTELIDTLADDKAIDLEAWIDRTTWELGFPDKLAQIARKIAYGTPLDAKDKMYLQRFRQREQKKLF